MQTRIILETADDFDPKSNAQDSSEQFLHAITSTSNA